MTVRLYTPILVRPMMSLQVVGLSFTSTFILMVMPEHSSSSSSSSRN